LTGPEPGPYIEMTYPEIMPAVKIQHGIKQGFRMVRTEKKT
jgi:hypothetical protein